MDTKAKKVFVQELIGSVQNDILAKVELMPEAWDGHELRRYIADIFEGSIMTLGKHKRYAKRYRAYKNELITRNL